jgi:hypothetical protein
MRLGRNDKMTVLEVLLCSRLKKEGEWQCAMAMVNSVAKYRSRQVLFAVSHPDRDAADHVEVAF